LLYANALTEYNTAIDLDPKDALSYFDRGAFYIRKKQYDMALADLNKALELDPKRGITYAHRAEVYGKQGRLSLALADWNKAVELTPASKYFQQARDQLEKQIREAGSPINE